MHLTYLMKDLARRRGRTVATTAAIALLVAIPLVLASVMDSYSTAIYLPFEDAGADMIVQKAAAQATDTPASAIRLPFGRSILTSDEIAGISAVDHIVEVSQTLTLWQYDQGKFISIEGLEPDSARGQKVGASVASGRFLAADDRLQIVIEKHFAKFYGVTVGDSFNLGSVVFEIVGMVSVADESQASAANAYITLPDARELLGTDGCSQLYIRLDALSSEDAVRSAISRVESAAVVISGNSVAASLGNMVRIYSRFHLLGSAILALVIAFILFQVNATALLERRRDIGIMQAVGWTRMNIGTHVVSEVLILTVVGCILGVIGSLIISAAIGSIGIQVDVAGGLSNELSTLTVPLAVSPAAIGRFSALALAISVAVSVFLVRRASGMKPLANLRPS